MSTHHTKQRLANALKMLSKTCPLEKITVCDIVHIAGVNRSTFYAHFLDRDDLISWIFKTDITDHFVPAAPDNLWVYNVHHLLDVFQRDIHFYAQAIQIDSVNNLRKFIFDCTCRTNEEYVSNYLTQHGKTLDPDRYRFLIRFIAHGITDSYIQYIRSGASQSPRWMAERQLALCEHSVCAAIDNLLKQTYAKDVNP